MKRRFTKTIVSTLCALTLMAMPFTVSASEMKAETPNETVQFLYGDGSNARLTSQALANPNNFIGKNGEKIDLPEDTNPISLFASCSHVPYKHVNIPLEMHTTNKVTRICSVSKGTGKECKGCGNIIKMVSPFKFSYTHNHR